MFYYYYSQQNLRLQRKSTSYYDNLKCWKLFILRWSNIIYFCVANDCFRQSVFLRNNFHRSKLSAFCYWFQIQVKSCRSNRMTYLSQVQIRQVSYSKCNNKSHSLWRPWCLPLLQFLCVINLVSVQYKSLSLGFNSCDKPNHQHFIVRN